jgi:hypothetical protein
VLLGALVAGDINPSHRSRGWAASMLLGSVVGLVSGFQFANSAELTAGEARTMAAVGDFGLLFGFGAGFLLHLDGGPSDCQPQFSDSGCFLPDPDVDKHARGMAAAGLVGGALGLTGGYLLARHRDNSWGDGEVLRASTGLGVWLAAGVADVAGTSFELTNRAFTGALMAGGSLGLVLGDRLVRNTNFTPGHSMLVDLSMISGGLLGAGTTYLVTSGGDDRPYLMASALGATIGFALSYWGFHDAPEGPATRQLSQLARSRVSLIPTVGTRGERGLALGGLF